MQLKRSKILKRGTVPAAAVKLPRDASKVQEAVNHLNEDGKVEQANHLVHAALTKWPGDLMVLVIACSQALRAGEFERALQFGHQIEDRADKPANEPLLIAARFLIVAVLLTQNKLEEAEGMIRSLPEHAASDPLMRFCRALILRSSWQLDEADRLMTEIYPLMTDNSSVQLQWGWTQQHAGRYEAALETFRKLDIPDAKALSCETLTFMGRWNEALQVLDELLIESPFNIITLQVAGMIRLRRHLYGEVLQIADKILSLYRGDTVAFQLKAAALIRLGRIDDAQQVISEGLQLFPLSAGLLVYRGWASFALHDLDTAQNDFNTVASKSPHDPTSHTGLAAIAFQRRDYQEALALFRQVAEDSVIDPGAQANLALTFAAMERDNDAVAHYTAALERDPDNVQALTCKSGVIFRHNEPGRARTYARKALSCDPDDASCRVTLAAIESALGDYESASTLLEQTIRDSPLFAQAYLELGILERKQGNGLQARALLRHALEIDSGLAGGYRELADLELQEDRLHQAEAILRDGIDQVKIPDSTLYARLGHVMRLIGEQAHSADCYEDASSQLTTALRIGPDSNFFAEFELGIVQLRQGAYSRAQRTFEHILELDGTEPHAKVMLTRISVLAREPRSTRWWSLTLAGIAVAQSITAWAVFLMGKLSATTFSALLPLFVGLLLVAALLPRLTKVQLGGLQAEMATVSYQPEVPTIAGPTPRPQMTTSTMVGTAFWFWP